MRKGDFSPPSAFNETGGLPQRPVVLRWVNFNPGSWLALMVFAAFLVLGMLFAIGISGP